MQTCGLMVVLLALSSSILSAGERPAEIRFLGKAELPGTASDRSGIAGNLEDGSPADRLGGLGSGIAWLGEGLRFAMISDRGPGDGATTYQCRFHVIELAMPEPAASQANAHLVSTHLLRSSSSVPYIGATGAFPGGPVQQGLRFDPEAIRTTADGTILIADEYGPSVIAFDATGKQLGTLALPSKYSIANPAVVAANELPPANVSGRFPNRGLESLAVSGDKSLIYGMMQGPLLQDGAIDADEKKIGTNIRLIEMTRDGRSPREFVYPLESPNDGVSELEWFAPGRLLVLERDGKPGVPGAFKRLFEVDLNGATDTSEVEHLPATGLPADVRAVSKRLFLDLLDPAWGLAGEHFPAKIEGIAFGPTLHDGSRLLVISSDNDFKPEEATSLYLFSVKLALK